MTCLAFASSACDAPEEGGEGGVRRVVGGLVRGVITTLAALTIHLSSSSMSSAAPGLCSDTHTWNLCGRGGGWSRMGTLVISVGT